MECEVLEQLIRSCGRVVSRDQLSLHLYSPQAESGIRAYLFDQSGRNLSGGPDRKSLLSMNEMFHRMQARLRGKPASVLEGRVVAQTSDHSPSERLKSRQYFQVIPRSIADCEAASFVSQVKRTGIAGRLLLRPRAREILRECAGWLAWPLVRRVGRFFFYGSHRHETDFSLVGQGFVKPRSAGSCHKPRRAPFSPNRLSIFQASVSSGAGLFARGACRGVKEAQWASRGL